MSRRTVAGDRGCLRYDSGPVSVPIPGVSVEQGGTFEGTASGGMAF